MNRSEHSKHLVSWTTTFTLTVERILAHREVNYRALLMAVMATVALVGSGLAPAQPNVPATAAEQRVALIVGNAAYKDALLANPLNDARDVAKALSQLGFHVTLRENISQQQMRQVVRDFGNQIKKGGVGLFYFAGHGIQVKGRNFLIPVGADIQSEDEVEDQSVDVNLVLEKMESAQNRVNIVVLDACRNNPFARAFRSATRGLAPMDAAKGTFIAYATAPGSVAADGTARNSPFTKHLLVSLKHAESDIEKVFKRVRAEVVKETNGRQTPWESSSLIGDFYFSPDAARKSPRPGSVATPAAPSPLAVEIAFWESIQQSTNPGDFQAYLSRYPNGQFAELARNRLQKTRPVAVATAAPASSMTRPETPPALEKQLAIIWPAARSSQDASPVAAVPVAGLIRQERGFRVDDNGVTSLAVSPDGRYVATGTHSKILIWDMTAGTRRVLEGLSFWTYALAFSRDGRTLASGANSQIILWDIGTWDPRTKIDTRKSQAHSDAIKSLSFSPDGARIASGGWRDQTVYLWDAATGGLVKRLTGQPGGVASVSFSPDGNLLASIGEGGAVVVWNVVTDHKITSLEASSPSEGERSLQFSPNGAILAAGGSLWEVGTWKRIARLEGARANVFSPEGRYISTWSGNSLSIWDIASSRRIKSFRFSESAYSIAYAPDGKKLYAGVNKFLIQFDLDVFSAMAGDDGDHSIRALEMERDQRIASLQKRGEFETSKEFEQRVRAAKSEETRLRQQYDQRIEDARAKLNRAIGTRKSKLQPYSVEIALGKYDADTQRFEVEMLGEKFLVPVPRDEARELAGRKTKEPIVLEGNLRYLDRDKVEIVNGKLRTKPAGG